MNAEMTSTSPKEILGLLRSEIAIQRRHLRLLLEQRVALLANDQEAFAAAHVHYDIFTRELEAHTVARREMMGGETVSLRSVVNSWPAAEKAAGTQLLDALAQLIERVKVVALQNTDMVSNHLMYTQFMLSVMVRSGRRNGGYASPASSHSAYTENIFINQTA
ncbi:MAG TPA: flagellar export chaperone FlgN [Capsulimonadaceae bacterium]|jgi:hypothetical protein